MYGEIQLDLFHGVLPVAAVLVPSLVILALRARFALGVLGAWILGVWLVLMRAASYPLVYYYMPLFPALWLVVVGALGKGVLGRHARAPAVAVMAGLIGLGLSASTHAQLGTRNPLAVVAAAPSVLLGGRAQRNPFVDFDSAAPAVLDGNVVVLPYAHDWRMDDMLKAIADKIAGYPPERTFSLSLNVDTEYMSRELLGFKLRQHGLQRRLTQAYTLGRSEFPEVDFMIMKSGEVYKGAPPSLDEHRRIAADLLADDGAALRARGFALLFSTPLPDGSTGSVWFNRPRLASRYELVAGFQRRNQFTPATTMSQFSIGGDTRLVLYMAPPEASKPLTTRFDGLVIPPAARIDFGVAINPSVWQEKDGDGAVFVLDVETEAGSERLFEQVVDPANRLEDRRWIDASVSLARFAGARASILATVLPRATTYYDQTGWSCLCIVADDQGPAK
jgi:hypothetical protein